MKKGGGLINKKGRPKKEWDEKDISLFKELCGIFCTRDEIASVFDVDKKTLNRLIDDNLRKEIAPDSVIPITFQDAFDVYSLNGKASLRRAQFKKALDGNTTMLIWLGKQFLDQQDSKLVVEQTEIIKEENELERISREFEDYKNSL